MGADADVAHFFNGNLHTKKTSLCELQCDSKLQCIIEKATALSKVKAAQIKMKFP